MDKPALNVPVTGHKKAKFPGIVNGREKFAFLYVAISALVLGCAMTFSGIVGLTWSQTALLLVGLLIGAWGTLFSLLEVRRLSRTAINSADEALEEGTNPYTPRTIVVEPPTGEPYPHHEDYAESQGFDQGQLTSRLPDATPFIGSFLRPRRKQPV